MPSVAVPHHVPDSVHQFCASHGLLPHLMTALRLVEKTFSPIHCLQVSVEVDPETDEEAIVIDLALESRVSQARDQKRVYTRRWVESAPPEARERIRLFYDLV